jgi:hypothetical protein
MDFTREELEWMDMALRSWDGWDVKRGETVIDDQATYKRYERVGAKVRGMLEQCMIQEEGVR